MKAPCIMGWDVRLFSGIGLAQWLEAFMRRVHSAKPLLGLEFRV